jgi:hypothetical protein
MKHLLILLSFLLLSSPVIGQSSKYESVNQCVLQTMKERELTGNKMFEMVKEECERSLGNSENKVEVNRGVLFLGWRNGKVGYYKEKWEGGGDNKDWGKYEGEIENGEPNGQGTITFEDGSKYVGKWKNGLQDGQGTSTWEDGSKFIGEWKDSERWNGTKIDKNGNFLFKVVNGKQIKQ